MNSSLPLFDLTFSCLDLASTVLSHHPPSADVSRREQSSLVAGPGDKPLVVSEARDDGSQYCLFRRILCHRHPAP